MFPGERIERVPMHSNAFAKEHIHPTIIRFHVTRKIIMSKVIVFGSLNMDLSIESDHMPNLGETIIGRGFITNPAARAQTRP